jgi:dihydroxy-acid dehydratase
MGVKGAPGMGMASRLVFAIEGAGLGPDTAVVTDGQLSGLVNKGLVVGEVTPEAATGGPLGLVRQGDIISIDVEARKVDLEISNEEFARRHAAFKAPPPATDHSWTSIYAQSVRPLSLGATLVGDDKAPV